MPGDEAILRREDDRLTVEPITRPSLLATLSRLVPLDVAWPEIESPPPEPIDLWCAISATRTSCPPWFGPPMAP